MIRYIFSLTLILLLALGCRGDAEGVRLFEVTYPVIEFDIPAGQAPFSSFVVAQPNLATGFTEAIADAGLDANDVDLVGGLRARVTSLTGDDFGQFERIELRACPVGQAGGCDRFDLLFSVSDLFRRRQLSVPLNPGLRNFRELFLEDRMQVELVMFAGEFTSVSLQARLEWSVQAVGDLD